MQNNKPVLALLAGHHRAFFHHWRDPGSVPTRYVKEVVYGEFPFDPINNEHHEAEKLVHGAAGAYSGDAKILVCPFTYDLGQKKKWIEHNNVDWVLSIHLNSPKYRNQFATGFEAWVYHPDAPARVKAQSICRIMSETLGIKNRMVKYSNDLYILKTDANEILLEMGFITNPQDVLAIRKRGVEAIIQAINSITK